MVADPLETKDLAEGSARPVELLHTLFKQFQKLQQGMNDPIDVSAAFDNFMNGVKAAPAPEPQNVPPSPKPKRKPAASAGVK